MAFHTLYDFVQGPMVLIAVAVFVIGSVIRIVDAFRHTATDPVVRLYFHPKFALRSIARWLTPFATRNMRIHPATTLAAFVMHIGVVLIPFFIFGHMVLFYQAFDVSWPTLPDPVTDGICLAVLCALAFFALRRLTVKEVRYLSTFQDFLILMIVAAPFLTGMWAFRIWPGAEVATLLHMLSGELMLMAIPFTKLSHMFYFFMTRGYIGSEFGAIRNARDW